MITDSLVKKKFISETLREGIHKIYDVQEEVVRKNYKSRTGRLRTLLSAHSYDTEMADGKTTLYVRIWPYLRFLDMAYRLRTDRIAKHKRRKLALYNRVVWGVLYRETFPELRHGFTDEVRMALREQLQAIYKTK